MKHIKYNDKWFNYYSSAKYPGKSILTGKNINVGDSIYWCVGTGGFLAEESKLINNIEVNIVQHHFGPADPKTTTYNDSVSREMTCKLFKREFDIDLKNHTGLYIKDNNNEFIEFNNGQYCEDLIGFNNDKIIIPRLKAELISYEKQRRYWLNKRIELKQFIINLNIKDKIKQVLIFRFIELKKRREISDILHYSLSYIDRLLKRGLFFIDEKLKSSSQKVVI